MLAVDIKLGEDMIGIVWSVAKRRFKGDRVNVGECTDGSEYMISVRRGRIVRLGRVTKSNDEFTLALNARAACDEISQRLTS